MCFDNLNLLVTQQQLNKVIPIMWWLITMPVTEIPKLHREVTEQFEGRLCKPRIVFIPSFMLILIFGCFLFFSVH